MPEICKQEGRGGVTDGEKIVWNHDDPTTLPKYSNQHKIASSLDEYESILNSKIPQHLKIKLLDFYKQKYMNSLQNNDIDNTSDDDSDTEDETNLKNMQTGLHKVLANIGSTQKKNKRKILWSFLLKILKFSCGIKTGTLLNPQI